MELGMLRDGLAPLLAHMRDVGYSEGYVASTERTARRLMGLPDGELGCWDDAFAWAESGTGGGRAYMRAHVRLLMRFCEGDGMPRSEGYPGRASTSARDGLGAAMSAVVDAYESGPVASAKASSTVASEVSSAACFLARLEALGVASPADATEEDVLAVVTTPDGRPAWSRTPVRQAKAVISASGVDGSRRLASLIPVPREWARLADFLDEGEREAVTAVLADPGSGISMRDRAIGRVLYHTGMRRGDVCAMRMEHVDWDRDLIEMPQRKTEAPLRIPLIPQVGNAIFDYVTGERGASGEPYVFLSTSWPYGRLSPQGVHGVACRLLDAAGVRASVGDRRGTHLFRRTVASAMMGAGVDRAVIASTLGHSSARTTERYMVADVEGLRRRALDVSRFPVSEGALADE